MTPRRALLVLASALLVAGVAPAEAATSIGSSATSQAGSTSAGSPATSATPTNPETPVPVAPSDTPPPGRRLSADRVLEIAAALPKMRSVRAEYPGSYGGAYTKGPPTLGRWQVSYFSKKGKEIGQVIIADADGRVLEQWTGFQIAWAMARGYPGEFGRHVNALYIWIPLCFLFFVPFFDWRKPLRWIHLDLLVLLSFSVSLAFFNHGRIGVSTPLVYPPLVYLLVRMLVLARVGHRRSRPGSPPRSSAPRHGGKPLHILVPVPWLAVGVVFLVGFRVGLNLADSNVIDVGYAGVIGAQRITSDRALYGNYPSDNEHGDTYGPVNYEAYVPFEQLFGWSGRWDDLPAAHAAAIVFDLLALALLFLLGRRVRGPALGTALAYAWVSYPFTLFSLESNSNDTLVAALVLAALLAAASAPTTGFARGAGGALAALAGLTKFAPLALAPLLATHDLAGLARSRRSRSVMLFSLAFLLTAIVVFVPALTHDSLHTIYERTIAYQANRESPFSIWGLYGNPPALGVVQTIVQGGAIVLALAFAILPRRPDLIGLGAAAAAILVAVQLGADHWFYLYIPWFFGPVMLALLGVFSEPVKPVGGTSGSARSSRLVAA